MAKWEKYHGEILFSYIHCPAHNDLVILQTVIGLCVQGLKRIGPSLHFLMMLEITFLSDFQNVLASHHFMSTLKIIPCPQAPKERLGPLKFSFLKLLTSRYISHCSNGSVSVRYYFSSCYISAIQYINYLVINFSPITDTGVIQDNFKSPVSLKLQN